MSKKIVTYDFDNCTIFPSSLQHQVAFIVYAEIPAVVLYMLDVA